MRRILVGSRVVCVGESCLEYGGRMPEVVRLGLREEGLLWVHPSEEERFVGLLSRALEEVPFVLPDSEELECPFGEEEEE